jgi:hypothetical protein
MKTKEEIEQLAFLKYPRLINDPYNPMEDDNTYERQIWIDAYTQSQEDMADKKYTEEDMMLIRNKIVSILPTGDISAWDMIQAVSKYTKWLDEYINSLNKQD